MIHWKQKQKKKNWRKKKREKRIASLKRNKNLHPSNYQFPCNCPSSNRQPCLIDSFTNPPRHFADFCGFPNREEILFKCKCRKRTQHPISLPPPSSYSPPPHRVKLGTPFPFELRTCPLHKTLWVSNCKI